MGRHKKGQDTAQEVEAFSVDKDDQLEHFNEKPIAITKDVIKMFDIKPVAQLKDLHGSRIHPFTGAKGYKQALENAYEWRDMFNENKENKEAGITIVLVDYFAQEFKSKSILISYDLKTKRSVANE